MKFLKLSNSRNTEENIEILKYSRKFDSIISSFS